MARRWVRTARQARHGSVPFVATDGSKTTERGVCSTRRQFIAGSSQGGLAVLAIGGAGLTSACDAIRISRSGGDGSGASDSGSPDRGSSGSSSSSSGASPSPTPEPDPDLDLLTTLRDDEQGLVDRYAAALERFPRLRRDLARVLDHHRRHLALARELAAAASRGPLPTPLPTGARTPVPSDSPTSTAPTSPPTGHQSGSSAHPRGSSRDNPRTAAKAVRALGTEEDRVVQRRSADVRAARSGELSRLCASIAACEAMHPDTLARVGGSTDGGR